MSRLRVQPSRLRAPAGPGQQRGQLLRWIQGPGRTSEGICVSLDCSPAEQVVQLTEQFQNWAADQLHDTGLPPEWPECPGASIPPTGFQRTSGTERRSGRAREMGAWSGRSVRRWSPAHGPSGPGTRATGL